MKTTVTYRWINIDSGSFIGPPRYHVVEGYSDEFHNTAVLGVINGLTQFGDNAIVSIKSTED